MIDKGPRKLGSFVLIGAVVLGVGLTACLSSPAWAQGTGWPLLPDRSISKPNPTPGGGGSPLDYPGGRGIVSPPPNPGMNLPAPFASFTPKVKIKLGPMSNDDWFKVGANVFLATGSDGIDPLIEDVSIKVGTFSTTIPAGSFVSKPDKGKHTQYVFEGVINGVSLSIKISQFDNYSYRFTAKGRGADLTGAVDLKVERSPAALITVEYWTGRRNPVNVELSIGDVNGSAMAKAKSHR